MILSIDVEKAFDKNPTPFHEEIKNRRNVPQHNKCYMYNKSKANIVPNGEQLKMFPLKSGKRQGYPLSPLLFNIVLEFLATAIRQEHKINREGRSQTIPICR
jgi:hypothetical protein